MWRSCNKQHWSFSENTVRCWMYVGVWRVKFHNFFHTAKKSKFSVFVFVNTYYGIFQRIQMNVLNSDRRTLINTVGIVGLCSFSIQYDVCINSPPPHYIVHPCTQILSELKKYVLFYCDRWTQIRTKNIDRGKKGWWHFLSNYPEFVFQVLISHDRFYNLKHYVPKKEVYYDVAWGQYNLVTKTSQS